jgi:hypothetical protein
MCRRSEPLNCDPGQHEENGKCVDSPEPLNVTGQHEENGKCA